MGHSTSSSPESTKQHINSDIAIRVHSKALRVCVMKFSYLAINIIAVAATAATGEGYVTAAGRV